MNSAIDKVKKGRKRGFTIVELLIVIVVIAILAAITIVAYSGLQTRTNDTLRRDGAAKLLRAYKLWVVETGQSPAQLGCGYNNQGNGFLQWRDPDGSGGAYEGPTCIDQLAIQGYLPADFTDKIATNTFAPYNTRTRMFMLTFCPLNPTKRALIQWHLQAPTDDETARATKLTQSCTGGTALPYASFGMTTGEIIEW